MIYSETRACKDEESVEHSSPAENMCIGETAPGVEGKRSVETGLPSTIFQDPMKYGQQTMW